MKYNEVLKAESIDIYKKMHKNLFVKITNLYEDLLLLKKMQSMQEAIQESNCAYYLKILFMNTMDRFAFQLYSIVNDTGSDAITIRKFKNLVYNNVYKSFKEQLGNLDISSKWDDKLKDIKEIRHNRYAHNLGKEFSVSVQLNDIIDIYEEAKNVFKALSFDVDDFYDKNEYYNKDFEIIIEDSFIRNTGKMFELMLLDNKSISQIFYIRNNEHWIAFEKSKVTLMSVGIEERQANE